MKVYCKGCVLIERGVVLICARHLVEKLTKLIELLKLSPVLTTA
jgi:hypothetical protein